MNELVYSYSCWLKCHILPHHVFYVISVTLIILLLHLLLLLPLLMLLCMCVCVWNRKVQAYTYTSVHHARSLTAMHTHAQVNTSTSSDRSTYCAIRKPAIMTYILQVFHLTHLKSSTHTKFNLLFVTDAHT